MFSSPVFYGGGVALGGGGGDGARPFKESHNGREKSCVAENAADEAFVQKTTFSITQAGEVSASGRPAYPSFTIC